jgi:hypothetical protein
MASNAKKKTTMAKRNRETALREKRVRKEARKVARKQAAADAANGVGDPSIADYGPLDTPTEDVTEAP